MFAVNESATPDPYRRWTSPKSFACETTAGGVQVVIGDQEAIDVTQQAEVNELAELEKIGGGG